MAVTDADSPTPEVAGSLDAPDAPAFDVEALGAPRHRPRWVAPVAVGALTACGCAAVAIVNPQDSGRPVCWSKALFGIDCPFCGGLRCTNELVRGDWLAAADHNVLLAVALPALVVVWLVWLIRSVQDRPFRLPTMPRWGWAVVAVGLLAFTVARNVGGAPWIDWLASGTYRG
jgi:hypothetical protein